MHPYLEKLKEYPARSRFKAMLGSLPAAIDCADMVGPSFLDVFPSEHKALVSESLGHPFKGTPVIMEVPPPPAMHIYGPYPVLMGIPIEDRAGYVLKHLPDFEDFFREIPEHLLLLAEDDRKEVSDALGIHPPEHMIDEPVLPEPTAVIGGSEEDPRFGKVASSGSTISLAKFLSVLRGLYDTAKGGGLTEAFLEGDKRVDVGITYTGVDGEEKEGLYWLFPKDISTWKRGPLYTKRGEVILLHLYEEESNTPISIPLVSVGGLSLLVPTEKDGMPVLGVYEVDLGQEAEKPQAKKKEQAQEVGSKPPVLAGDIYKELSTPLGDSWPVATLTLRKPKGKTMVVSKFPNGMPDTHGSPQQFGEGPEGYLRAMLYPEYYIVDVPLANIVEYSVGEPLQGALRDGSDQLANKYPRDIEYIKKYDKSITELKKSLEGSIIAVIDTETAGFTDKLIRDTGLDKRRGVGQLLQVSGMKIVESGGTFVPEGSIFDEKVRLLPHNMAVLHREVHEGFDERLGDRAGSVPIVNASGREHTLGAAEDHADILHSALQFVHRPYLPRRAAVGESEPTRLNVDALGVPKSHRYLHARGKGQKSVDVPDRMSAADLQVAAEYEAGMKKEHEVLRGYLAWLRGVDVVCGHNAYLFDRKYLNMRIAYHKEDIRGVGDPDMGALIHQVDADLRAASEVPYLDTLHVLKIMFLPAVGILAYSPMEELPDPIRKEAQGIAAALKSGAKLGMAAKALGVDLLGAHDSMNDVRATAKIFINMLEKLESWEQYLVGHKMYERDRHTMMVGVAKMFSNRERA